ncbi:MAG: serine protease [Actinobacteria bacterium]|nr:MAG: serine protease [Actinomycetota bacterium]
MWHPGGVRDPGGSSGALDRLAVLLALALVTLAVAPVSPSPAAGSGGSPASVRVGLPGEVSPLLGHQRALRSTPAHQAVTALVELKAPRARALATFVRAVSDPGQKSHGHYLTPSQFESRFAPSTAAAAAVAGSLRAAGLRIAEVPRNRRYVAATGTVEQMETLFDTRLVDLRVANGAVAHTPTRPPSVPASLAPYVSAVRGLDTSAQMHPLASPPPASVEASPCSGYWGQLAGTGTPPAYGGVAPWAPCGYTPQQVQGAYGIAPAVAAGLDGRGQTVAVIDAYSSSTIQQDVDTYSDRHGLPHASLQQVRSAVASSTPQVPGTQVDPQGWAGEETLDIEAVHAMAPGARIVYEGGDSSLNVSLTQALNDVVANHRAQIVTNSYGSAGDVNQQSDLDPIFAQAAAEGMGIYFASGDAGDETKDPNGPHDREVDSPGNDPMVTAVGGTSLGVGASGEYLFETGWGTYQSSLSGGAWSPAPPGNWQYGGGGGTSQTYGQPDWQRDVVPSDLASYWQGKPAEANAGDANGQIHVPGRAVPDVALDADANTGFLEGLTEDFSDPPTGLPTDDDHYGEFRVGGTSLSTPLFAGIMALADQAAGRPHGFLNPALYLAARQPAYRDVVSPPSTVSVVRNDYNNARDGSGGTTTSLKTFNQVDTLHVRAGYDDATGLGSPAGLDFLRALAPGSSLIPAGETPGAKVLVPRPPAGKHTKPKRRACGAKKKPKRKKPRRARGRKRPGAGARQAARRKHAAGGKKGRRKPARACTRPKRKKPKHRKRKRPRRSAR